MGGGLNERVYDIVKWGADAGLARRLSSESNMLPEVTAVGNDPLGYKTAIANGYSTPRDEAMALRSSDGPIRGVYPEAIAFGGAAAASKGIIMPTMRAASRYAATMGKAVAKRAIKAARATRGVYGKVTGAFDNAVYGNPVTANLWNGGNTALSARSLASDGGVRKTVSHFAGGEYADGVRSLAGDVLDATGFVNGLLRLTAPIPWATYASGARSGLGGTYSLARDGYRKYGGVYRDAVSQTRPAWERAGGLYPLRARMNIAGNVFREGRNSFLMDYNRYRPMQNISLALRTPVDRGMWRYDFPIVSRLDPVFRGGDLINWWYAAADGIGYDYSSKGTMLQSIIAPFTPRPLGTRIQSQGGW